MPLPPGLALDPATGVISGVPTVPGTYNYTLRVRDAQGALRDVPVAHLINPYDPPVVVGTPGIYATRGVPYSYDFNVTAGTAPYTWSIASGSLPTGLSINAATGVISGTPTQTSSYTNRALTVRVVDGVGSAAQLAFTLRYRDALATSHVYPVATRGEAYSNTPVMTGGHAPITFAIVLGSVPSGLSFDPATGRISGTPTSLFSGPLQVLATDAAGNTDLIDQTFTVVAAYVPVSISGAMTGTSKTYQRASGTETISPSSTLAASGGNTALTYSWVRTSGSSKISVAAPSSISTGFSSTAAAGENLSATFTLTATDGTTSATYTVTITANNTYVFPSLTGSPPTHALRGKAYAGAFTLSGGKSPFAYAITAGELPAGLTLNGSTGAIAGTPTATSGYGNIGITVRVTDALSQTDTASFTLTYANALALGGTPGPAYTTEPYSWTPSPSGGFPPYTFAITSGSLPAGLSLNASTGAVTGTPTTAQTSTFTMRMTDDDGNTASASDTITVNAYATPSLSGTLDTRATRTKAYSDSLTRSNGLAPFVYTLASGTLPPGLTLSSSTGVISGTPTSTTYGNHTFVVRVTDALGNIANSASQTIQYRDMPVLNNRAFTRRRRTEAINESVATTANAHTPVTYSVVSGSLPTGASLNANTGLISGTLTGTTYGNYSITIRATDAIGNTDDGAYTLAYANVVSINVGGIPAEGEVGEAFSGSAAGSGGFTPYTYSISAGALPAGLSLSSSTGAITGTPTAVYDSSFTVRVADADGAAASAARAVQIYAALSINVSGVPASATVGAAYSGAVTAAGGKTPRTFAISSGSLPAGLSLNASTGAITGTPTTVQSSTFTVRVTDALGHTASASRTIAVASPVFLQDSSVNATNIGANATARLQIGGSVVQSVRNAVGPTTLYTWMLSGATSDYEVRFTRLSGDTPSAGSAALDTWLPCSSVQLLQIIRTVAGTSGSGLFLVEIRPAGGGATLASCQWSLSATRDSGP